jgi:Family of unknown function (DUF5998)
MSPLPARLSNQVNEAGYYPSFVSDVLDVAVAGEPVTAHLVHAETTFDTDAVRRHLSVLVLTPTRLVFVHADDHAGDEDHHPDAHGVATSEAVPLDSVRSVVLTHVVTKPANFKRGTSGRDLTLAIGWGSVSRLDLEPATCGDPACDADHGYTGSVTGEDVALRISTEAEGASALQDALAFAKALSAATARSR